MKYIENEYCELKSILTKEIKKEIVAFANTNGGKIYIGINDEGKIIGVEDIDSNLQALTGMINEGIKPSLIQYTKISNEKIDNHDVIVIEVQSAPNKPYYLADKGLKSNGVYLRHGASSIQVTDEIIRKMIFENNELRYEELISKEQNLSFDYLIKKFNDSNLLIDENKYKALKILNENNKYTNLGLLLSDQCPYSIKCAIFDGINKISFHDRKEFSGSILKQVDDIFEYFELFNKISGKIVGLKRIDTRDYPEYSLREALLNAVIHRSYYFNNSIMVTLYDNKFEILSMDGLIDGITMKEIFKGVSLSRNPNLANIFYRLGYVESFGTGIGRIMDSYSDNDKKPVFETTDNTFSIILPNVNYHENNIIINNYISSMSQEEKIVNFIKSYNKINRNETDLIYKVGSGKSTIYMLK